MNKTQCMFKKDEKHANNYSQCTVTHKCSKSVEEIGIRGGDGERKTLEDICI